MNLINNLVTPINQLITSFFYVYYKNTINKSLETNIWDLSSLPVRIRKDIFQRIASNRLHHPVNFSENVEHHLAVQNPDIAENLNADEWVLLPDLQGGQEEVILMNAEQIAAIVNQTFITPCHKESIEKIFATFSGDFRTNSKEEIIEILMNAYGDYKTLVANHLGVLRVDDLQSHADVANIVYNHLRISGHEAEATEFTYKISSAYAYPGLAEYLTILHQNLLEQHPEFLRNNLIFGVEGWAQYANAYMTDSQHHLEACKALAEACVRQSPNKLQTLVDVFSTLAVEWEPIGSEIVNKALQLF